MRKKKEKLTTRAGNIPKQNYFADVEQTVFNPANIVPGIVFSPEPDKMLRKDCFFMEMPKDNI